MIGFKNNMRQVNKYSKINNVFVLIIIIFFIISSVSPLVLAASPPTVVTNATTGVEETNVTLCGYLSNNGSADTTCGFRLGNSPNIYNMNLTNGVVSNSSDFSINTNTVYLYERYITSTGGATPFFSNKWWSQVFTVGHSGTNESFYISSVKLYLYRDGFPGHLYVSIRNVSGNLPTGPDLVIGSMDGNTTGTAGPGFKWYEITFDVPYELSKGSKYAIVFRAPDGDSGNHIKCNHENNNGYTEGHSCVSNDAGATWSVQVTDDIKFETYGIKTILSEGQIYYCQAWGNNSEGFANGSEVAFLTKPNVTTNLAAIAYNSTQVNLTWTSGTGANNTYIERNTASSWARGAGTFRYNGSLTQYEDTTGLNEGTTYYYQAWSYTTWNDLQQWSDANDSASNTTTNKPTITNEGPRNQSTNINPTPQMNITINDADGDSMTLTWYSNSSSSGSWTVFGTNSSAANGTYYQTNSNFTDKFTTYYWNVTVSDGTDTNTSDTYHFTVANSNSSLSSPSPTNGSAGVSRQPTLQVICTDANNDTMNVTWKSNSEGTWTTFATNISVSSGTTIKQTNSNFSSYSTTYYWSVNVTDGTGWTNETYHFKTKNHGDSGAPPVIPPAQNDEEEETETIKEQVENLFDITLTENFTATDSNGDEIVDTFTDPNGILNAEHFVNMSGNASFLISINSDLDKLFIWDTEADTITQVTHSIGTIIDTITDEDEETITVRVTIEKTNWTYMEMTDQYPDNPNLTVKTSDNRTISSDMIWRENNKIYVLDDPATEYHFIYSYKEALVLFDVVLELIPTSAYAGENINALIELTNVGEPGLANGTVNYTLSKEGEVVWSAEESIFVLGQKAFNKTISTEGLTPGEYTFEVVYSYGDNQTASAQGMFAVNARLPLEGTPPWILIVLVIILIIILIIVFLFKTGYLYMEKTKKEEKEEGQKDEVK